MARIHPALTDPHHVVAEGRACTVARVIDGDTFDLACPQRVRVRLADIDAPELRGRCAAETALAEMVRTGLQALTGQPVTLWPARTDRWGRTVGRVEIGGQDMGETLLSLGWAQPWPHGPTGRPLTPRPDWCAVTE
jgi:micrococcal nuclease